MAASSFYIMLFGNSYVIYWLPRYPVFLITLTQSGRLPIVTYPHCPALV